MRRMFRKTISLILAITFIVPMTMSLSSCGVLDTVRNQVIEAEEALPEQEIARLIISAIKNKNNVSESYSQIPAKQRDGISFSVFTEYVAILRSVSSEYGTIKSFRILNDVDAKAYLDYLLKRSGKKSVPSEYGKLSVIELEYGDTLKLDKEDSKCRFCLSINDEGETYLSKAYITGTIAAYNYLEHYFSMLENNNTDGLFAIMAPLYDSDIYINAVINAKARYTAEYYLLKVRSTRSEYIFEEITPFIVQVTIPMVLAEDGESMTDHTVVLTSDNDGNYNIKDDIPLSYDSSALGIFDRNGKQLGILGVTLNAPKLAAILGGEYYAKESVLSDKEKQVTKRAVRLRAYYSGIVVTMAADIGKNNSWDADVTRVVIYDNNYTIDGQITVGMNKSELLLIHPMIDEADYTLKYNQGRREYIIRFTFDEYNNIKNISVTLGELDGVF